MAVDDHRDILDAIRTMGSESKERHEHTQIAVARLTDQVLDVGQRVTRLESEAPRASARASAADLDLERRLEGKIDELARDQASGVALVARGLSRLGREARWGAAVAVGLGGILWAVAQVLIAAYGPPGARR